MLKATTDRQFGDLETFGFLFEALVEHYRKIYAESFGVNVFHYRDYNNKEVDAIIELEDGQWCEFEIKPGANQIDKAAANLVDLKNTITENGGIALCAVCDLWHVHRCLCSGRWRVCRSDYSP